MRSTIISSLFALAAVASAAVQGVSLNKRDAFLIVSPDGSCGVVDGVEYTCGGSGFGRCCGAMGVCGNDETSCSLASGCNPVYGDCDGLAATTSSTILPTITPTPVGTVPGQTSTSTMGTPLLTSSTSAAGNGTVSPTFISTTMPLSTGTGVSSGIMSGTGLPTGLNGTSTMLGSGTGLPTITSAPTPTGSGALMPGIISTLPVTNPDVVCYVYTSLVTMTASVA